MNTIQTTKANSTIRRFFNRMGGGGVKALNYKAVNINGEGGGTSNEDAEKMYEALFGQTPYVTVVLPDESVGVVPLYEIFADTGFDGEIANYSLFFKSSTPVPKAITLDEDSEAVYITFPRGMNIYMTEIPPEASGMPDTWYVPVAYDVNLVGYTTPTSDNPTTVSGTLPDKQEIKVLMSDHTVFGENPTETYHWDNGKNAFIKDVAQDKYYKLEQSGDNVIEWSYQSEII